MRRANRPKLFSHNCRVWCSGFHYLRVYGEFTTRRYNKTLNDTKYGTYTNYVYQFIYLVDDAKTFSFQSSLVYCISSSVDIEIIRMFVCWTHLLSLCLQTKKYLK